MLGPYALFCMIWRLVQPRKSGGSGFFLIRSSASWALNLITRMVNLHDVFD